MKVSIITVSFNSAETIRDTFDCISQQTIFEDIEYIVVDGGSTDGTIDIINEYANIITTKIIEPDNGIYDAMNKGIANATGDIIGILNSDDVYHDITTLELIKTTFETKKADIVYGNINYVSSDLKKVIRKWQSSVFQKNSFKKGWHPPHPSFFVKKDVYEQCGVYDLEFNISADFDFMLRSMELTNYDTYFVNEIITNMRIGGESNRSLSNIIKGNRQIHQSFMKNHIKINRFLYSINRILPKVIEFLR